MSNRLFQSVIHQMKDSVDCPIGVIDETGTVIACSELSRIGEVLDSSVGEKVFAGSEVTVANDMSFKSFGSPIRPEYAIFVDGADENAKKYVGVLAVAVSNIKQYYGDRALSLFIQPPSVEELRRRLEGRGTDAPEVIQQRIDKAEYELSFAPKFDKIVINDDLATAQAEALGIIKDFIEG